MLNSETVPLDYIGGIQMLQSPLKGQSFMSPNDPKADNFKVDDLIDQNIKILYDGLIQEGLPDRFKDLLALIRAEERLADTDDDAGPAHDA